MNITEIIGDEILRQNSFMEIVSEDETNENSFVDFLSKYRNAYSLDYLVWSYSFIDQKFDVVSIRFPYNAINIKSEKLFISKIKPCFRSLFYNSVNGYIKLLKQGQFTSADELSMVVPFKIEPDLYYTTKITIIPHITQKKVHGFVIKLIPVSLYDASNYNALIVSNGVYKKDKTQSLKALLLPPAINLTSKQNKISNYIHSGLTTTEIASFQDKALNSVYKINRKIMEKISRYYEIDFKDAKEAVGFYFNSFT